MLNLGHFYFARIGHYHFAVTRLYFYLDNIHLLYYFSFMDINTLAIIFSVFTSLLIGILFTNRRFDDVNRRFDDIKMNVNGLLKENRR